MNLAKPVLGLVAAWTVALAIEPTALALSCDEPRPFLSPADGSSVPPDPVLYLFDPLGSPRPTVRVDDRPVSPEIEQVGENAPYQVYALRIPAAAGAETIEVELRPDGGRSRFRVDAEWSRPEVNEPMWPEVADRDRPDWVAAGSSHLAVRAPATAPAYRVAVSGSREAKGLSVIVPGLGEGGGWIYLDEPGVCDGLFAPASAGSWLRLEALLADGSQTGMSGPVELEDSGWGDRFRALMLLFAAALLVAGVLFAPRRD